MRRGLFGPFHIKLKLFSIVLVLSEGDDVPLSAIHMVSRIDVFAHLRTEVFAGLPVNDHEAEASPAPEGFNLRWHLVLASHWNPLRDIQ